MGVDIGITYLSPVCKVNRIRLIHGYPQILPHAFSTPWLLFSGLPTTGEN